MLSFLVVMPSNPETSYFQLVEGILNIINEKNWGDQNHVEKAKLLCAIICYLTTQMQDSLPYHIPNVDSNDRIFTGNEEFRRECSQLIDFCFD